MAVIKDEANAMFNQEAHKMGKTKLRGCAVSYLSLYRKKQLFQSREETAHSGCYTNRINPITKCMDSQTD